MTTTNTTDMTVAQTIANQLGRAFVMLGATNLIGSENALSFKIQGCREVSHIRIVLDPSDTYSMTFMKIRGTQPVKDSPRTGRRL